MKKKHILLTLFLFLVFQLFSEDLSENVYFQVLNKTWLFSEYRYDYNNKDSLQTIDNRDKVELKDNVIASEKNSNDHYYIMARISYKNQGIYEVYANDLAPWETESLFNSSLLTDLNAPNRKTYIMAYYIDVLASLSREKLFQYEKYWSNPKNPDFWDAFGVQTKWYDYFCSYWLGFGTSMITNSMISIDDYWIALKGIKKIENGYVITGKFIYDYWDNESEFDELDFKSVRNKIFFDITMKLDGDYIDFYLEDESQKLATIVTVNQRFVTQFRSLMKTNTADLSNITWPTRADGSMDYPLKQSAEKVSEDPDETFQKATHITKMNFHLRTNADIASQKMGGVLSDRKVRVLEQGPAVTIEGVKGFWVKIVTQNGAEGWCFDGNLKKIPTGTTGETIPEQASESTDSIDDGIRLPLAGIIGGLAGICVLAGMAVFIRRKKG